LELTQIQNPVEERVLAEQLADGEREGGR